MKKIILPILLATLWISLSEFVRNTFILHDDWVGHYQKLGLTFPEQPVNGAVWGIWPFCFAVAIYILSKKFSLLQYLAEKDILTGSINHYDCYEHI